MSKLLKSEGYRFLVSPAVWVLMGAYFLLTAAGSVFYAFLYGNAPWLGMLLQEFGGILTPIILFAESIIGTVSCFEDFLSINASTNGVLILSIFIGIFILTGKTSGYIKNRLPAFTRKQLLLSNLILIAAYVTVLDLIYLLVMGLWSVTFFSSLPMAGGISGLLYYLLLYLLTLSAGLVVYAVCETFRNPRIGMVLAIIYTTGVNKFLYKLIDLGIRYVLGIGNFQIEYVLPLGMISALRVHTPVSMIFAAGVILVYGGLSLLFLILANEKRDL